MRGRRYDPLKRVLDVVVAVVGLLATAPVQLLIALVVRRDVGRPVLFRQRRPGRGGRIFTLYKFRTMRSPEQCGGALGDAERLTARGAWIRRTSLDELPSLYNVLRGDMSLVGPRPLLVSYLERYDSVQARRHEVRPGLTGLAQVRGRNAVPWARRLEYDIEYVDNRNLALDVRILMATVALVLRGSGVTDGASVSSQEFRGTGDALGHRTDGAGGTGTAER